MLACGALTGLHIALSREPAIMPKTYVQDLVKQACVTLLPPLAALGTLACRLIWFLAYSWCVIGTARITRQVK